MAIIRRSGFISLAMAASGRDISCQMPNIAPGDERRKRRVWAERAKVYLRINHYFHLEKNDCNICQTAEKNFKRKKKKKKML